MGDRYTIEISLDGKDNVSQHLSKVNSEIDRLQGQGQSGAQATQGIAGGLDAMATAATGFIASYGLMQIGQKIGELNELGAEVKAANRVFVELAGGPEEAATGLNQLRSATSGVVDDLTLMRGANQLLLTGLAQTTEEAAGLTEVAVKLGGAMGQGAAEAIDNLNSALLNNSFPRLDTLGISAANVRERVDELKRSGMEMSEAFSQAVLEQGRLALERLGPAANTSATAISRLTTNFQNMGQVVGNFVNNELETAATTLEQLGVLWNVATGGKTGIADLDAQIAQTKALTDRTNELILAREQSLLQQNIPVQDFGMLGLTNDQFMDYAAEHPELINASGSFDAPSSNIASGSFFTDAVAGDSADIAEAKRIIGELTNIDVSDFGTEQLLVVARDADIAFSSIAQAQAELEAQTQATTIAQAEQSAQLQAQTDALTDFSVLEAQAVDNMADIRAEASSLADVFAEGIFTTASGTSFFDPEQVAAVRSEAEAVGDEYQRLKSIAESSDYTLVSQLEVERAREIAANADSMANDAERMATAWENASLSMIAGTTDGGRENEFNQTILSRIEDPEQRAAMERQMNLNSGVENANSDVLDYGADLSVQISNEKGVAAGAEAAETFENAFEAGIQAGLSGEALKTYIEGEVGYALSGEAGSSGAEITVQQDEGYIALSQRTGYSREELEAANGGGQMLLAGQVIHMPDGSSLIAVGEGTSPEDIATGILGKAQMAIGSTPPPTDQYTYYDPATGTYTGSNDVSVSPEQAAASIISQEQADAVSSVEEDMISIETSMTNISLIDTSATFDPMVTGLRTTNTEAMRLQADLDAIAATPYRVGVALNAYVDYSSIPELANNPAFIELFATVVRNNPSIIKDATD